MEQKSKRNPKRGIANFFGALGYFFGFLQWFWAVLLYFSVIQSVTLFVSPNADKPVVSSPVPAFTLPNSVEMIILGVTVVVMVAVTIYALIKIPVSIVKTGNKVVHKTAQTMTPIVMKTQHKKDTKKFRDKLTTRLIFAIKLLLIIIPVILTSASGWLEKQSVDYSIALVVGCGLAALSIVFFTLQYAVAGVLRVKIRDLW
ncbi:MAG TPA: hypothetical protein VLG36_02810 [Candidatus Chromulinivoraceae bacterium]|nr:hypothetical protein [Candidatus Chromulinivoraceae bacterium]